MADVKTIEIIDWGKYPIGTKFEAIITNGPQTVQCSGRINKEGGYVYLCQNEVSGSNCSNKLGYKYSWAIPMVRNIDRSEAKILSLTWDDDFIMNKSGISLSKMNSSGYSLYRDNYFLFSINPSPFGNCQNLAIGNFNGYLSVKNMSNSEKALVFEKLGSVKKFSVVDIRRSYKDRLPPDSCLLFSTEYVSTNGSEMMIVGINNNKAISHYQNLANKELSEKKKK
jgi:hypothetical protein